VFGVFTLVWLPLVYGARRITDAVQWLGLGGGAVLAGALVLAGRGSSRGRSRMASPGSSGGGCGRSSSAPPYGVASLGCSPPICLAFLASSFSVRGNGNALAVLAT
jgi:hypothetical protein